MSGFEFAVVSYHPREGRRFAGPGLGSSWTADEERVRAHYAFLTGEWRESLKAAADENEASGFKGGNWDYMTWKEKEPMRFAIAKRPTPELGDVVEAEDGFV